jgi:hypothetical protein
LCGGNGVALAVEDGLQVPAGFRYDSGVGSQRDVVALRR